MSEACRQCPAGGWCDRWSRQMSERDTHVCRGEGPPHLPPVTKGTQDHYFARWAAERDGTAPSPRPQPSGTPPAPAEGPGTELTKLLGELGLHPKAGCPCKARAREMDQLGVAGCREHRDEIVGWLREQQAQSSWAETLTAARRAVTSGLVLLLDPRDPAPGLVNEAIRRAEAQRH